MGNKIAAGKAKRYYPKRNGNGRVNKAKDPGLEWIRNKYPQCEDWRVLALKWFSTLKSVGMSQLYAISAFFEDFLIKFNLPMNPKSFLSSKDIPDFFESACPNTPTGAIYNNFILDFVNFVINQKNMTGEHGTFDKGDSEFFNHIQYRHTVNLTRFDKTPPRSSDTSLTWVKIKYPQLESWRILAVKWLNTKQRGLQASLFGLSVFFEHYIIKFSLPLDPARYLSNQNQYPDFRGIVKEESVESPRSKNAIREFLDFVLKTEFSMTDEAGNLVMVPGFCNPIDKSVSPQLIRRDESAFSPLPYGYIDRLRQILVGGPNFGDWKWAQSALGAGPNRVGPAGPDWFPISESEIDRTDPDCVVRVRDRSNAAGGPILEMWSPVRWVALLMKLLLPLRTFQVRMLDSGESDTWRCKQEEWVRNAGRLARGTTKRPWQQGVFRRLSLPDSVQNVQLYINTNKTADIGKAGPDKGFTVPWPVKHDPIWGDVHYWLEKLCDWQEKYNPIDCPTRWSELDPGQIYCKSESELASFPEACFLFRLREAAPNERHLPILDTQFDRPWFQLLSELQSRLAKLGETHADGTPIQFVKSAETYENNRTTEFPLHSLRVSMVSGLALEGQVPYKVLMRAVGHSRLLMTLYYTKPGEAYIAASLADGAERLAANKEKSITEFLHNSNHEKLIKSLICNNESTVSAVIPVDPKERNPAGWLDMGHGVCLVGGNVSDSECGKKIKLGGCFNGGPKIGFEHRGQFAAVPGGPRNCVRCRWFVTMPWYLPALRAKFNNLSYHVDEAFAEAGRAEASYGKLLEEQFDAGEKGIPFDGRNRLLQAERLRESALARWNELEETRASCWLLIFRCMECLKNPGIENNQSLISVGTAIDVQSRFEETDSELLQLSGVCEDLELHPDLEPGKAIVRRSQLLDAAFASEGQPPLFLRFSEQEQLLIANEWMRRAAKIMNPSEPEIGKREVVSLIEAGGRLSERLGADFESLLKGMPTPTRLKTLKPEGRKNVLHDRSSS